MTQTLRHGRSAVFSWLILVGGLLLLYIYLMPGALQGGSIGGFCSGYCGASVNAEFISTASPDRMWFVSLTGDTPLTWKWLITSKWPYEQLAITLERWDLQGGSNETLAVKLPSMEYSSAGTTGVLTKELLNSWLTGRPVSGDGTCDEDVEVVFQYIQAAANGTLPRPRHHNYQLRGAIRGSMQHGLAGFQLPLLPMLGWFLVWSMLFRNPFRSQTADTMGAS